MTKHKILAILFAGALATTGAVAAAGPAQATTSSCSYDVAYSASGNWVHVSPHGCQARAILYYFRNSAGTTMYSKYGSWVSPGSTSVASVSTSYYYGGHDAQVRSL